jgi:phenylacetate-coenzyme A ligase PaaK-like adenylate-forming protein
MIANDILSEFPEFPLYSLAKESKKPFFLEKISELFKHHYYSCHEFKRIIDTIEYDVSSINSIEDLPFLPVRLFKMYNLLSVPHESVVKKMTSSGTTGQSVSKIFLDKPTALLQTKTLGKIVSSFLGSSRVPMIIIDSESTVKNRNEFSARAAGITGFSIFASKRIFALNDDMSLNLELIQDFVSENRDKTIFLFGFTFIVYQHFIKELCRLDITINLTNGVLIHGGGWKKLIHEAIDSKAFRDKIYSVSSISRVHDYYGMVEQTGTIHMECEKGYLHTPEYADIIIRDPNNFGVCNVGEEGLIQLLSLLPHSYPGQSLLTEDIGVILGEDDCSCGRKGKYFIIKGRIKNAEVRGCSDTYGESFSRG